MTFNSFVLASAIALSASVAQAQMVPTMAPKLGCQVIAVNPDAVFNHFGRVSAIEVTPANRRGNSFLILTAHKAVNGGTAPSRTEYLYFPVGKITATGQGGFVAQSADGDNWLRLRASGAHFVGEVAVEEDFGFYVRCTPLRVRPL